MSEVDRSTRISAVSRAVRIALPLAIFAAAAAGEALAEDVAAASRDLCFDRPGLGTPSCTLDRGRAAIEIGVGGWTRDRSAGVKTTEATFGSWLGRIGLTDTLEAQFGWAGYTRMRTHDRKSGVTERAKGGGDATIAIRQNLRNPDGSGFSFALMPSLSLPTGNSKIGAGDVGASLLAPMSLELTESLSLALTPSVEAAVDTDGKGRHPAYGGVVGLGLDISDSVSASLELMASRDRDPAGHSTTALTGISVAWNPAGDWQLDAGINLGLNRNGPDREVYFGVARRF